mmetsp:Transcript_8424/g.17343  ORF Transcript_8424/g.17343 Transcript_8424/m.17343 type:complete len:262 (+) Transcript_8424:3315-4100(+)
MGIVLVAEAAGIRTVLLGVGFEVASGRIEAGGQEIRHVVVAVGEEAEVPVFGVGGGGGTVFVVYDKPYYLAVAIVDINSGRFLVVVRESEAYGICCFRFIVTINKEGQMWFGMTTRFSRMVMMRMLMTTRFFRMVVKVLIMTTRFFGVTKFVSMLPRMFMRMTMFVRMFVRARFFRAIFCVLIRMVCVRISFLGSARRRCGIDMVLRTAMRMSIVIMCTSGVFVVVFVVVRHPFGLNYVSQFDVCLGLTSKRGQAMIYELY